MAMLVGVALAVVALGSNGVVRYLASQGIFQAQYLWGRVPLDSVADDPRWTELQRKRLALIPEIQAYGTRIGLASNANYTVINPDWTRTIWNVSASDRASFTPRAYWFPIVGTMPYLGFFDRGQARAWARDLEDQDLDVYMRTAGAFSSLGWYDMPIVPEMLGWSEQRLSDTLLHETAHATLWIPGSVEFNESFANFVGEKASHGYLVDKYGPESPEVATADAITADGKRLNGVLHEVFVELDAVYADPELTRREKIAAKERLFATLPTRIAGAGLQRPQRLVRWIQQGTWNNARMMQFRTYNRSPEQFQAVLDAEGGDLLRFIGRIGEITSTDRDPYAALERAAANARSGASDSSN
jgi:predicted aminopeptidase